MILSYHPCFTADDNRICAGRLPDDADLAAIREAKAVILPQGCSSSLYAMARQNCRSVFPNYDVRFTHAGKTGQIRLFQQLDIPHPPSAAFDDVAAYVSQTDHTALPANLTFPVVFKFDWGGEGETVRFIQNQADLQQQLHKANQYELSGQKGFILQTFIPTGGRVLRVVRIDALSRTYWRVAPTSDQFLVNLAAGATIDYDGNPDLQKKSTEMVNGFCDRSGINLAGFDVLFSEKDSGKQPLLLEINYFFGREGLGGSAAYLDLLSAQITRWIMRQDFSDD